MQKGASYPLLRQKEAEMRKEGRIIIAVLTAAAVLLGAGFLPLIRISPAVVLAETISGEKASSSDAESTAAEDGTAENAETGASAAEKYDEDGLLLDGTVRDDLQREALPDGEAEELLSDMEPGKAEADNGSFVIEETEEGEPFIIQAEEAEFDFSSLLPTSSEDLLLQYLELSGKEETEPPLSGNMLKAYRRIKKALASVAAGEEECAEAVIPLSVLDKGEKWIPESELGLSGPVCEYDEEEGTFTADSEILSEAAAVMEARLDISQELLAEALAEYCPYDLYWSGKVLYRFGPFFRYRIIVKDGEASAEFAYYEEEDDYRLGFAVSVDPLFSALEETPSFIADIKKTKEAAAGEDLTVILEQELLLASSGQLPGIVKQPEDFLGHMGDTAVFSVEAEGDNLSYRWQYSTDEGKTWKNCDSDGSDTPVYSFEVKRGNLSRLYRCVVTNAAGSVKSETVTVLERGAVRILVQPEDVYVKAGDIAGFTVEATGEDLSYRWQVSADGGSTWRGCEEEANGRELRFVVSEEHFGQMYRCTVNDDSTHTVSKAASVLRAGGEFKVSFSVDGNTSLFEPVTVVSGETYFSAEGWPDVLDGIPYFWYMTAEMIDGTEITEDTVVDLKKDITVYGKEADEGRMDGGNIYWRLSGTTLTFWGTGTVEDLFAGNRMIETVIFEDGVTGIEAEAFRDCESIEALQIADSISRIGEYAFTGCISLPSVTLPTAMETVSAGVFSGCTSLTEVIIPDTVTLIGTGAFKNCTSLKKMSPAGGGI